MQRNILDTARDRALLETISQCVESLFIIYLERPLGIVTKFAWGLLVKYPGDLGQNPL